MSFMEHLGELRSRILKALAGIVVAFLLSITFCGPLWKIVSAPAVDALKNLGLNPQLVAITPMEQFNVIYLKLPLLVSVFLASPWVLCQVWALHFSRAVQAGKKMGHAVRALHGRTVHHRRMFCVLRRLSLWPAIPAGYRAGHQRGADGLDQRILRSLRQRDTRRGTGVRDAGHYFLPDLVASGIPALPHPPFTLRHSRHHRTRGHRDADARRLQHDAVRGAHGAAVFRRRIRELSASAQARRQEIRMGHGVAGHSGNCFASGRGNSVASLSLPLSRDIQMAVFSEVTWDQSDLSAMRCIECAQGSHSCGTVQ